MTETVTLPSKHWCSLRFSQRSALNFEGTISIRQETLDRFQRSSSKWSFFHSAGLLMLWKLELLLLPAGMEWMKVHSEMWEKEWPTQQFTLSSLASKTALSLAENRAAWFPDYQAACWTFLWPGSIGIRTLNFFCPVSPAPKYRQCLDPASSWCLWHGTKSAGTPVNTHARDLRAPRTMLHCSCK